MPDGSTPLTLTLHKAIAEIAPEDWDACAGADNPFVSHAFLSTVEDSGSANARTGWLPQHAVLTNMHTDVDYADLAARLPPNVEPAYDGMRLVLPLTSP